MAQGGKGDKGYRLEELLRAYFLRAGSSSSGPSPSKMRATTLRTLTCGSTNGRRALPAAARLSMLSRRHGPKPSSGCCGRRGWPSSLMLTGPMWQRPTPGPCYKAFPRSSVSRCWTVPISRRISQSEKVIFPERISEEEFVSKITSIDKARRGKEFQLQYHDIKFSLIDRFGAGTINRALDSIYFFRSCCRDIPPEHRHIRDSVAADIFRCGRRGSCA